MSEDIKNPHATPYYTPISLECPVASRLTFWEDKADLTFSFELWGKDFTFSPELIIELKQMWFEAKLVPVGDVLKHRRGRGHILEQRTICMDSLTAHEHDLAIKTIKKALKSKKGYYTLEELTSAQEEAIKQMEQQVGAQLKALDTSKDTDNDSQ